MHKRTLLLCASLLVAALVAGCGGGESERRTSCCSRWWRAAASGNSFDMSKATATVSGKISFEGMPPANDKIQMSSDPYCQHARGRLSDGRDRQGQRRRPGERHRVCEQRPARRSSYGAPSSPVEIMQQNCHYIPHVFTIMTNQTLNVKNDDMTLHNIHVLGRKESSVQRGSARERHGQPDEIRHS